MHSPSFLEHAGRLVRRGLRWLARTVGLVAFCAGLAAMPAWADDGLVVIANAPLRGIDADQLRRIYSGRTIQLDGLALQPANLAPGQALRQRFMAQVMLQADADYIAYWTVRRYVGKGAPPREFDSVAELVRHVRNTPGALGYIDAADLVPGMHVVFRR